MNFPSVPFECRPGVRSARNVTKFHNLGCNSWEQWTCILFTARVLTPWGKLGRHAREVQ